MKQFVPVDQLKTLQYQFSPPHPPVETHVSDIIKQSGLTFKEAAQMIGISRQGLDLYIRGELQPTVEIALKLSHLLDTPVEDLFSLTETAWLTTAKDDEGRTIYYDHMAEELLSGETMKGKRRTVHYSREMGETISQRTFKQIIKEAENEAVSKARRSDTKGTHNRDTLAKIKERVRQEIEEAYPIRYETLYTPIERLDERH